MTFTKRNFWLSGITILAILLTSFLIGGNFINADEPIGISTCLELQMIGSDPETYPVSGNYILTGDINCGEGAPEGNDTRFWNSNENEWEGGIVDGELITDNYEGVVNNGYSGFEPLYLNGGSFDGAGYTISNLWIFRKNTNDVGLFGTIFDSTVQNLTISSASVVGGNWTGILAGRIEDGSVIENITINNSMMRAYIANDGGMLTGELNNSSATDIIVSGGNAHGSGNIIGGIIGFVSKSTVTDSTTSADVDGGYAIGGAFGEVRHSEITNVHATGNVLGEDNENIGKTNIYSIGGFIGRIQDIDEEDIPTKISNSSSSGSVTVNQITNFNEYYIEEVGGFIGSIEVGWSEYPVTISDSFTTQTAHVVVNARTNVEEVGGFIGYAQDVEISNSHAQGNVTAETVGGESYGYVTDIGGFIGDARRISILNSFATGDVVAQTDGTEQIWEWNEELQEEFLIDVIMKTRRVGGFIGDMSYEGDIRDSYATGDVFGGSSVGGFAGQADDSEFHNSYATGNVTGNHDRADEIGGFVGYTDDDEDTVYVYDSYATGNVSGHQEIGGFVGDNNSGHIFRSYATGNVTGTGNNPYRIGGFVGQNDKNSALIEESYATGNVSGYREIGGFVGENENSGSTIRDSYARGSVTGVYDIGGFAGYNNGQLMNVYSTGLVSGDSTTGGLVGRSNGTESYSFWDTDTSGQVLSAGGEGRTTAQMKMISTYTSDPGPLYSLQDHNDTASFRYLIWYITGNQGSDRVQVSELNLYLNGNLIEWPEGTEIENTDGFSPDDEDVYNLVDDSLNTKWLDSNFELNGGSLVAIDLGEQVTFDEYVWATANDYLDRDPSAWQLLGSNDHEGWGTPGTWNEDWTLLDSRENQVIPDIRNNFVNMSGADWDFENVWKIESNKNNGYPHLQWSNPDNLIVTTPLQTQTPRSRTSSGGSASPAMLAKLGITPNNQTIESLMAQVKQLQELLAQLQGEQMTKPGERPTCMPLLRLGSRGENVRLLQQKLNVTPQSGIFGPLTLQAVRDFQTSKGIRVDGIVGPQTCGML